MNFEVTGFSNEMLEPPTMAQPVRPASSKPEGGRAFEADDLIRRRSADSIMAREEHPSS